MAEKILVVDDEEPIRDMLDRFLKEEGYEVILASTGEEAMGLAESEEPDLIFMDIIMPGLDGIEICRKLRAQEKTRSIPVMMATAFSETVTEALEVGVTDFVTKPFQLQEVSIRIKSILRVRHLTDELGRATAYTQELQKHLPRQGKERP